jgi:hypothetical protein
MPSLVEKTGKGARGGIWEVKWTWMPAFLAMDQDLVALVDKRLNELFAGGDPPIPGVLESAVRDVVCKKYPMAGLREALEAIQKVDPTIRLALVDEVAPPSSELKTASSSAQSSEPSRSEP